MFFAFCIFLGCERYQYYIKQAHTSESTNNYIYMPSSNKYVRCCHTNIIICSLNSAFIVLYNTDILRKVFVMKKINRDFLWFIIKGEIKGDFLECKIKFKIKS